MKNGKDVIHIKFVGMFLILLIGLAFHELYKSTEITALGLISPVNESKWEHWKMAYTPMIVVGIFEYRFIKNSVANYIFSLALGILAFQLVTFGLIELYDILLGRSTTIIHVITFLLGGFLGQTCRYLIMTKTAQSKTLLVIGSCIIVVQLTIFTIFTLIC